MVVSLRPMVAVATPAPIVAPLTPVMPVSSSWKVSARSAVASSVMATRIVLAVSPGLNTTDPVDAVKSLPAVADPATVR